MSKMYMFVRTTVNPGVSDEFRRGVATMVAATNEKPGSVTGYEWFLDSTGSECAVIEVYDSPADHASHVQRVVIPHSGELRSRSHSTMDLAGNVPAPLIEQMRQRGADVNFYGPRILGKLDAEPGETTVREGGTRIFMVLRFAAAGQVEAVRKVAEDAFKTIGAAEDVIAFEVFLDPEAARGIALVTLEDAAAAARHARAIQNALEQFRSLGEAEAEIMAPAPVGNPEVLWNSPGVKFGKSQIFGVL